MELLHNEILHCTFEGIADNNKKQKNKTQFIRQFIILLASAVALMCFGGLAGRERGVGVPFLYNRLERA